MTRVAAALLLIALAVCPAAAQDADLVEAGRRAFVRNGCHGCHTLGQMGTPIGPDLSRVGAKYSGAYLEQWLRDPASVRPSGHMPLLELADADVHALAVFFAAQR